MADEYKNDSMLDIYIFETSQLIEQLEQLILYAERENEFSSNDINEIFRIMHTIKGSSAMMSYHNISTLAHELEELFYFIREKKVKYVNKSKLSDLVLDGIDFIKIELQKIKNCDDVDGDAADIINNIKKLLQASKDCNNNGDCKKQNKSTKILINKELVHKYDYKAVIKFEEESGMESFRAIMVLNNLKEHTDDYYYIPEDILESENCEGFIKRNGLIVFFNWDNEYEKIQTFFNDTTISLKSLELIYLHAHNIEKDENIDGVKCEIVKQDDSTIGTVFQRNEKPKSQYQNIISVNVDKVDKLMDLVGEIVIAEAMVRENPDVSNMDLPNFKKATVQLHKIINELQAIVMSIRMVPLANTFYKMNRIVRDMGKKLDKKVELKIYGQDTEVDKNIIEHISDPLMHLIRNSVDHGIESDAERKEKGKNEPAEITLEAKNSSGEVLIIVKDNGRGLNKDKILAKAKENNLWNDLGKEVTAKEIYKFICMPGFSTKDNVSEFSGRGVGMDVVCKNIERIGGTVEIESELGESTTIALKIPLTLAIIDGMNITVGKSKYTIPTTAIKESFKVKKQDIIMDTDGNEMVIVRGKCYPIKRLHAIYNVATSIQNICDGICIMVENQNKGVVVFADELIGERQVVVKALPNYLKNVKGLMGCTLLGDGSISLIIDVENLFG